MKYLLLFFAIIHFHPGSVNLVAQTETPSIRGISNSLGFREHRAGLWSYLNPEIHNPTTSEAHLEVVLFFAGTQNQKFSKRVIVPPRTVLRTTVPVLIPANSSRGIDVQVQLYDISGSKPRLLLKEQNLDQDKARKRSYDTAISIRDSSFGESGSKYRSTAMFQPAIKERLQDQDDAAELVSAARIYFNHNGRIGTSTTMYLPSSARAFESIEQIVLHNDHLLNDSAGLDSVRRWVARGGNLWIMLDLVSEETVQRLLGDAIPFQKIGQTSLNSLQIIDADPNSQAAVAEPRNFEKPVEMVRVILNRGNLIHAHDGWPAAFWIKFNQGTVLFTTVGSRAWMRDRNPRLDPPVKNRLGITKYMVTDPMEQLGYQMYAEEKAKPVFSFDEIKGDLINQIGYQVISRNTVITILSIYTLVLITVGTWFGTRKKLERLFFIGPALALLTAFTFYLFGMFNQNSAPATVASFQFVQTIDGGNELQVDGMSVLYSREKQDFELGASNDGELEPITGSQSGELKKTVWETDGTWKFHQDKIEPGLGAYHFTSNVTAAKSIMATAVFDEKGLTGSVKNSFSTSGLEDSVLALPGGKNMAVQLSDLEFTVNETAQLTPGQFVESSLLTDKQRWRQSIYQNQFPDGKWESWVKVPTLFSWSDPLITDIRFPETFRRVGGALIRIPVAIEKSPVGAKVKIPAAFIGVTNALNSRNAISPNFDSKTKKWIGSISKESTTRIRFQIPRSVHPLKLESAELSIRSIKALDRIIEIKSVGTVPSNIEKLDDFTGNFYKKITDPQALELDQQGGLSIDINIAVKPEFYQRQKQFAERQKQIRKRQNQTAAPDKTQPDITKEKLELTREELSGIELTVSGTVGANTDKLIQPHGPTTNVE